MAYRHMLYPLCLRPGLKPSFCLQIPFGTSGTSALRLPWAKKLLSLWDTLPWQRLSSRKPGGVMSLKTRVQGSGSWATPLSKLLLRPASTMFGSWALHCHMAPLQDRRPSWSVMKVGPKFFLSCASRTTWYYGFGPTRTWPLWWRRASWLWARMAASSCSALSTPSTWISKRVGQRSGCSQADCWSWLEKGWGYICFWSLDPQRVYISIAASFANHLNSNNMTMTWVTEKR